MKKQRRICK